MASSEKQTLKVTQQRMQAMLRGAFAGPPTPLKDIPRKNGESRKTRRKPTEPKSA